MSKQIYAGHDTPFYNSDIIFVEYHDVIKCPWFLAAMCLTADEAGVGNVFDFSPVKGCNTEELYEWYVNRKYRNILANFRCIVPEEEIMEGELDGVVLKTLQSATEAYTFDMKLNFFDTLQAIVGNRDLVHHVYIYSEDDEPGIEMDMKQNFPDGGWKYVHGDFEEVVKSLPSTDITYVFSDANKVNELAYINRLNMASVLVADGYRYNYLNSTVPKINHEKLAENHTFKLNYFNNLTKVE